VTVSEGSVLAAGGSPFDLPIVGGAVVIRGGQLIIEGGSIVTTDTSDFGGAAVGIDLAATDSIVVREGSTVSTFSTGASDASPISIRGGNLTVTGIGTTIDTQGGGGNGGAIDIQVANADVLDGGKIRTASNFQGGNIAMAATGTLTVSGAGSEISTGTFLISDPDVFGGDITISARDLVLRDRGLIRSGSGLEQAGQRIGLNANAVSISGLAGISGQAFDGAAGAVEITTPRLVMDAGFINTSTLGAGDAGQIAINATTLSLTNGAQIASSSQIVATGAGGAIAINVPGSVTISGTGPADGVGSITLTNSQSSGLFSTTEASGAAGQVAVSTPTLTVTDGGTISVATKGTGSAGSILANVGNFNVAGGSRIDSSTTAGGAGGAITVNGSNVSIGGANSGLFSTASNSGSAGQIAVSAANVAVTGGGTIDSSTTGAGAGGAINVSAASQVEISSGGSVRADSLGAGNTGSIAIAAGDRIIMESGSISTRAVTSDGGNITLTAPNIIRLGNSQISTSVQSGTGAGGNIFIDPQFVILTNSTISANAFGGPGGNITIVANNFLADPSTSIVASSALSTPGTVQIQSPDNNVASDIAQLPRELVDASRLLRGGCAARRTGAPSSFTVVGRGGVPLDPDGYLPSFSASGAQVGAARGAAAAQGFALAMAGGDCWR
jgi:large exoprotein involved in heme utilization and adhesion